MYKPVRQLLLIVRVVKLDKYPKADGIVPKTRIISNRTYSKNYTPCKLFENKNSPTSFVNDAIADGIVPIDNGIYI